MDRFSRAPSARAIEAGHVPFAAIFALGEALRFLGELGGPTEIEKRILTLAGILRQEIVNCGLSPISDGSSGIISFDHPDASGIRDRMKADNIIVGGFKNLLRASVSFYNNEDDLDRFVHALKRCL